MDIRPPRPPQTPPQQTPVQPASTPPNAPPADPTVPPTVPGVAPPISSPKPSKGSRLKSVLSTIGILLVAPLLALFITAFVFQSYEVDGPSMERTLQTHDRLIIWKVKRTWARITNHDFIPSRGEVVVFVSKGLFQDEGGKDKQLIKRVIALPGERVTVADGKLTVFNKANPDGFNPDITMDYGKDLEGETSGNVDITVPDGEVFVMGDHRSNSLDSRYFGPVPAHDIIGTLTARILPLNEAKRF